MRQLRCCKVCFGASEPLIASCSRCMQSSGCLIDFCTGACVPSEQHGAPRARCLLGSDGSTDGCACRWRHPNPDWPAHPPCGCCNDSVCARHSRSSRMLPAGPCAGPHPLPYIGKAAGCCPLTTFAASTFQTHVVGAHLTAPLLADASCRQSCSEAHWMSGWRMTTYLDVAV